MAYNGATGNVDEKGPRDLPLCPSRVPEEAVVLREHASDVNREASLSVRRLIYRWVMVTPGVVSC